MVVAVQVLNCGSSFVSNVDGKMTVAAAGKRRMAGVAVCQMNFSASLFTIRDDINRETSSFNSLSGVQTRPSWMASSMNFEILASFCGIFVTTSSMGSVGGLIKPRNCPDASSSVDIGDFPVKQIRAPISCAHVVGKANAYCRPFAMCDIDGCGLKGGSRSPRSDKRVVLSVGLSAYLSPTCACDSDALGAGMSRELCRVAAGGLGCPLPPSPSSAKGRSWMFPGWGRGASTSSSSINRLTVEMVRGIWQFTPIRLSKK